MALCGGAMCRPSESIRARKEFSKRSTLYPRRRRNMPRHKSGLTYETPSLTLPVSERDHLQGPQNAPITLLEYGDFQCPFCGQAYDVVKQLQDNLSRPLRFAFR